MLWWVWVWGPILIKFFLLLFLYLFFTEFDDILVYSLNIKHFFLARLNNMTSFLWIEMWELREIVLMGMGLVAPYLSCFIPLISTFQLLEKKKWLCYSKNSALFICFSLILFMSCHAYMTFVCHHGHLHFQSIYCLSLIIYFVIGSLCSFVIGRFCSMLVILYFCNKKDSAWLCTDPVHKEN